MNQESPKNETINSEFDKSNDFNEYQYLLKRLRDIKEKISLLENQFLTK